MDQTKSSSLEKFESRAGWIFIVLSFWLPIPFVGIVNFLQIAILASIGYKDGNPMGYLAPFNLVFFLVCLIMFVIGLTVMISKDKYHSLPHWIRLVAYLGFAFIYFLFYLLYQDGHHTPF